MPGVCACAEGAAQFGELGIVSMKSYTLSQRNREKMSQTWIGEHYGQTRLLLQGESTYSWMENEDIIHPSPRHSIELVEEVIKEFPSNPFMTKLTRALASKEAPNEDERAQSWSEAAFTNYVQTTVGIGSRIRPTSEMWLDAANSFPNLLESLKPRNIIVLGKDMWRNMPQTSIWLTDDVQGYRLSNNEITMCWAVNHPSAGLSWRRLADLIKFIQIRKLE